MCLITVELLSSAAETPASKPSTGATCTEQRPQWNKSTLKHKAGLETSIAKVYATFQAWLLLQNLGFVS